MTRTLFVIWLAALLGRVEAQQSTVIADARLYAAFDSAYVVRLQTTEPALLLRWNYYLDNAFTISDFPSEKGDISQFPIVRIPDMEQVNILVLEKTQNLRRAWNNPTFYRIEGAGKVLMYYSGKTFNRKFKAWLDKRGSRE